MQRSQASLAALSKGFGIINPKTVAKWRKRQTVEKQKAGPKEPRSSVLSKTDEAMIVAFRRHTLLPLDDCLCALQASIPHLTRSALHRCFQRHEISRLPDIEGDKPKRQRFKRSPIGFFHLDIAEVQTAEGKLYLFVAIDRTIKEATVKRFHYHSHKQLRTHLNDFMAAYNFGRRLKTLNGLTPYEYVCKIWTAEPERFIINPT
uniref:hypothetical protein n=1 Tax=Gluconobacter thailandicus TaxID=257438 RepID=UPI0012E8B6ED|nr:hypothetical protein [Gluconobacter thailandicus]